MRTFVRVAERGNLSAVARELGAGQSTVTRHLRELEAALGAALLSRTTRRVTLTDEGSRFYHRSVLILHQIEEAGDEVREARGTAAGTVRVSCTAAFGVLHVSRLVFAFQDRHPGISVDLSLTDERVDLVRDGVDLAIRLGPLADSALRLRRLGRSHRLLVAAPGYLRAHGRPDTPADLSRHEVIRMANVAGSDVLAVTEPGGQRSAVPVSGRLRVDHGLAARQALLAGRGIAPAHRWLVDDLLAAGELNPVLAGYTLDPVPLSLLVVPDRAEVARVRLLIDFLTKAVAKLPGIDHPTDGTTVADRREAPMQRQTA